MSVSTNSLHVHCNSPTVSATTTSRTGTLSLGNGTHTTLARTDDRLPCSVNTCRCMLRRKRTFPIDVAASNVARCRSDSAVAVTVTVPSAMALGRTALAVAGRGNRRLAPVARAAGRGVTAALPTNLCALALATASDRSHARAAMPLTVGILPLGACTSPAPLTADT